MQIIGVEQKFTSGNLLTYNDIEFIASIKSSIVQALGFDLYVSKGPEA